MNNEIDNKERKIYWQARTSSGGTLSLFIDLQGEFSKDEKETSLADAIEKCVEQMENSGYIPFDAQTMSSRDIAKANGKSRQYWEKLLRESKIRYKETSAGKITTDLWVKGYLDNKETVDKYVNNVKTVLKSASETTRKDGFVDCPICHKEFRFFINGDDHFNGICRSCNFYVHTSY